jgi:hypothetical protein
MLAERPAVLMCPILSYLPHVLVQLDMLLERSFVHC